MSFSAMLTDRQLASIGRIAVASASLERLVDHMILLLTKLPEDQLRLLIPNVMMASKLDILDGLFAAKLRSAARKAEAKTIISEIKHVNSSRVIAIHGQWQPTRQLNSFSDLLSGFDIQLEAINEKGGKKSSPLRAEKLESIAKAISACGDRLFIFCLHQWIRPAAIRSVRKSLPKSQ